jgi:hypothetical protein
MSILTPIPDDFAARLRLYAEAVAAALATGAAHPRPRSETPTPQTDGPVPRSQLGDGELPELGEDVFRDLIATIATEIARGGILNPDQLSEMTMGILHELLKQREILAALGGRAVTDGPERRELREQIWGGAS